MRLFFVQYKASHYSNRTLAGCNLLEELRFLQQRDLFLIEAFNDYLSDYQKNRFERELSPFILRSSPENRTDSRNSDASSLQGSDCAEQKEQTIETPLARRVTAAPIGLPWTQYCKTIFLSETSQRLNGFCRYGNKCDFAHNIQELARGRIEARIFFNPSYKHTPCNYGSWEKGSVKVGTCVYGIVCTHAHSPFEIELSQTYRDSPSPDDPFRNFQELRAKNSIEGVNLRPYPVPARRL